MRDLFLFKFLIYKYFWLNFQLAGTFPHLPAKRVSLVHAHVDLLVDQVRIIHYVGGVLAVELRAIFLTGIVILEFFWRENLI